MLSKFSASVRGWRGGGGGISRFALLAYLLYRLLYRLLHRLLYRLLMPGITNSKNKFRRQNLSLGKETCPVPTVDWRADCFYTANDDTCYRICLKLILVFKASLILITPWSRVLPEKFPEFYGTPSFTTTFTSARHVSLSRARAI
jgi:hypothetical protein